jgi:hypothetical protein
MEGGMRKPQLASLVVVIRRCLTAIAVLVVFAALGFAQTTGQVFGQVMSQGGA